MRFAVWQLVVLVIAVSITLHLGMYLSTHSTTIDYDVVAHELQVDRFATVYSQMFHAIEEERKWHDKLAVSNGELKKYRSISEGLLMLVRNKWFEVVECWFETIEQQWIDPLHFIKNETALMEFCPLVPLCHPSIGISDVRLRGPEKSGTTWLANIVFSIIRHNCASLGSCDIDQDSEVDDVKEKEITFTFHDVAHNVSECTVQFDGWHGIGGKHEFSDEFTATARKRDHFAWLFMIRDPRDTALSNWFYFGEKRFPSERYQRNVSPEKNADIFMNEYFGVILERNLELLASFTALSRTAATFLFHYERMMENPRSTVASLAALLHLPVTEDVVQAILRETSFESMKQQEDQYPGKFASSKEQTKVRQGEVGGCRKYLSSQTQLWARHKIRQEMRLPLWLKEEWLSRF